AVFSARNKPRDPACRVCTDEKSIPWDRARQLPKALVRRSNKAKRVCCQAEKNPDIPTFLRSRRDLCFPFRSSAPKRADANIPSCANLSNDRAEPCRLV